MLRSMTIHGRRGREAGGLREGEVPRSVEVSHRWLKMPVRSKRMSWSMLQQSANVAANSDRVVLSRVPARSVQSPLKRKLT